MTAEEFNEKWKNHLEEGHYGMAIYDAEIIDFLDAEFAKEVKVNKTFQYAQIKLKFGMARVYTTSDKSTYWEQEIDRMFDEKRKIQVSKEGVLMAKPYGLDNTFPVRLWTFLNEIEVCDLMSEEEKDYLMMIASRLRRYQEANERDPEQRAYLDRTMFIDKSRKY